MTALKIDLYTDIVCPWCLIGQTRFDSVLSKHFADLAVDIEHHPFQLMPDCPPEGMNIAEVMSARGIDPVAMRVRPEAEARAVGLVLDLGLQPIAYPTLAGHTLIRLARQRGTQHKLSQAIALAYFLEARNIADVDTLSEIAAEHGFRMEEAKRLLQSAQELDETRRAAASAGTQGIRSVPHFVFNGAAVLSGSQSEDAFVAVVRQAQEKQAAATN